MRLLLVALIVCVFTAHSLVRAQDCVITPKPFPQEWQLWSLPTAVEGCTTDGQALARFTLTDGDRILTADLVQSVGSGARLTITRGRGGSVMFEMTANADGTGEGVFSGIGDVDFNTLVSDGAWVNIATSACPSGALQGQIKIIRCPNVPVTALLTSDQVVPPWSVYPDGHGLMVGEWNPATHEITMTTMHLMTSQIIAAGLFGPAREGDNGAGVNAYMFELSISGRLTTDKIIMSLEQEVMMGQGLIFHQIQDIADLHIRGQLMLSDCFDCQPPALPPREPCVPATRPEPQVWMLTSVLSAVDGCASSNNAQGLARLTLSENGHNLEVMLVHSAGNATTMSVTNGQGGAAMFDVQPGSDGTGQGTFPSITQEQFDLLTTDKAFLSIATEACPGGALAGKVELVLCPNVPVSAFLRGSEVVLPWTPLTGPGSVGLMVGTWNPSTHHLQIRTIHLMPKRIIAHALFGPAAVGQNPSDVNPQIVLSLFDGPMSTDSVGLTFEMEPMMLSGLMFQQVQDVDDAHIRGQIETFDCFACVQAESTPSPGPPNPADLLPPRNGAAGLQAALTAVIMLASLALLALL